MSTRVISDPLTRKNQLPDASKDALEKIVGLNNFCRRRL